MRSVKVISSVVGLIERSTAPATIELGPASGASPTRVTESPPLKRTAEDARKPTDTSLLHDVTRSPEHCRGRQPAAIVTFRAKPPHHEWGERLARHVLTV